MLFYTLQQVQDEKSRSETTAATLSLQNEASSQALSNELASTNIMLNDTTADSLRNQGLSGVLELSATSAVNITAASLNAAPADTVVQAFDVQLHNAQGATHTWASPTPVLTPGKTTVTVAINAPTIVGSPTFMNGELHVSLVLDTDSGVAKIYTPGDTLTCKVQTNATDTMLGYPVAFVTFTINVT